MAPIGIVGLSYGKRDIEPSPVNRKLAIQLIEIVGALRSPIVTVAQWEIAKHVATYDRFVPTPIDRVVDKKADGSYLDSKDVLEAAFEEFRAKDVKLVIVVANPFLHLAHVRKMVERAGFTVLATKMESVGFDNSPLQLQWWCRGPIRSIFYAGLQVIGKLTGINFHGIGEKAPA